MSLLSTLLGGTIRLGEVQSRAVTVSPFGLLGFLVVAAATIGLPVGSARACDYTVRDIGFVPFSDSAYTLVVRGAAADSVPEDLEDWLAARRVRLQRIESGDDREVRTWRIELTDGGGRRLLLASSENADSVPDLKRLLVDLFETRRMKELRQKATASFSQIIFIAGTNDAARDVAVEASGAMQQLEPMLPRPVNLPIHVLDLAPSERPQERLLLWCLGLETMSEEQSALSVVYGRGRLAGPVLTGVQLTLENTLRQLALVGESCECDTSRDWTLLPEVPLFWNASDSELAKLALGFDPTSAETLADVKDVLSRGRRGDAYGRRADRLDQIVTGYFEGSITQSEPTLLAIPPGRESLRDSAVATVIQGDGWGFEVESKSDFEIENVDSAAESSSTRGHAGNQAKELSSSGASALASMGEANSVGVRSASTRWLVWPVAIAGLLFLTTLAVILFFRHA